MSAKDAGEKVIRRPVTDAASRPARTRSVEEGEPQGSKAPRRRSTAGSSGGPRLSLAEVVAPGLVPYGGEVRGAEAFGASGAEEAGLSLTEAVPRALGGDAYSSAVGRGWREAPAWRRSKEAAGSLEVVETETLGVQALQRVQRIQTEEALAVNSGGDSTELPDPGGMQERSLAEGAQDGSPSAGTNPSAETLAAKAPAAADDADEEKEEEEEWFTAHDQQGKMYFYTATGKSSWTKPERQAFDLAAQSSVLAVREIVKVAAAAAAAKVSVRRASEVKNSSKVKCPHCGSITRRDDLQRHVLHCAQREVRCSGCGEMVEQVMRWKHNAICVAVPVACPDCRTTLPRGDLESHRKTCVLRTTKCTWCNASFTAFDLEKHNRICGSRKRICNWCNRAIAAQNFAKHNSLCALREKPCELCGELVPLLKMEEHIALGCPLPRPEMVESLPESGSSRWKVSASELASALHDRDEWFLLRRIDDLTNDAGLSLTGQTQQ